MGFYLAGEFEGRAGELCSPGLALNYPIYPSDMQGQCQPGRRQRGFFRPLPLTGRGNPGYMKGSMQSRPCRGHRLGKIMRRLSFFALLLLGTGALWGALALPISGGQEGMSLSKSDKELLFQVARASIQAHLQGEAVPPLKAAPPHLCEPRGVFVSLHRQGRLRGCIGYLEAVKPLMQAVQEMAAAAAFHDPRFSPLRQEELADLDIEISVLSPMRQIKNIEEIEVGKHGLYIVKGLDRGLLLPQVATQYNWDRLTFLRQTCGKACLNQDAWKEPDTRIFVFTAEVFSEHSEKTGSQR
jgi:AmmeMemoRadiSam system protein A